MVGNLHLVTDTSVLLPKVKTFSNWYLEGAIGKLVYSLWKMGADRQSKNLHQTLNRTWRKPIQADLCLVAQEFLVRTLAFIDQLNTFVKEFRSELMLEGNGADATKAWLLLSATLSDTFKAMPDAYDEAGDKPEDVTDLTLRAARVLWGTWQCHRVMAQFFKVGFRKPTCALPALTLHLFSCKASTAKVDELTSRLASMENTVAALGGQGPNESRGVSQKAFDTFLRKDHNEPMAKRLNVLEDRSSQVLPGGLELERSPRGRTAIASPGISSYAMVEMGTELEQMTLLDPNELGGISVAVAARYFPWWACVLGKARVTLSLVYLLSTSPWLEPGDTYFGQFNVRVMQMKAFSEVVPDLKGVHLLFLDASLLLSGRDSRTLGQELGVKCIVSISMFS